MFQLYASGPDFLRENQQILQKKPLQTAFFVSNAQAMPEIQDNAQGFIAKVAEEEKVLLAIRYQHHPMVLYGDRSLCEQLTDGLVEHGLTFRQVLAQKELMEMFLVCYLRSQGGDFRLLRGLELMGWKGEDLSILPPDSSEPAQPQDKAALVDLVFQFYRDALHEWRDIDELEERIEQEWPAYRLIRRQGRAVSIAKKARAQQEICAVSNVYTQSKFRYQGLARQVVSGLTRQILQEGKLPYLYADLSTLIGDRLYSNLGYRTDSIHMEFLYIPDPWKDNR